MIVRIPEDVYSYENKVWGNFTARILKYFGAALVVAFLVFAGVFWSTKSVDLAGVVCAVICLPIMYCGIHKQDGQYLEQILKYKYEERFKYTPKRKFVMTNLYETIQNNQKEWVSANDQLEKKIRMEAQSKKKNHKKVLPVGKTRQRSK